MCTGGGLGASELTGGGHCLLVGGATADNGGDGRLAPLLGQTVISSFLL